MSQTPIPPFLVETEPSEKLLSQPERALQMARDICTAHDLPVDCTRIPDGSRLVFSSADQYVLKIFFSQQDNDFFRTEALFLDRLSRQLPVPTPHLHTSGYWGAYPYIIMEYLQGPPLNSVWSGLTPGVRRDIMQQLGQAVRALHDLPTAPFAASPFQWHNFIDQQREHVHHHHRAYGLTSPWIAQLNDYLTPLCMDVHAPEHMVPLHTELMPEHIFVQQEGESWRLTGLIDFEPAMIGQAEYEFCAVGVFLTPGEPALFREFLSAYGYRDDEFTDEMSRRLMQYLLLHRYCNLTWFLSRIPEASRFTTLQQLEHYWFAV